jgi:hypothetical protein
MYLRYCRPTPPLPGESTCMAERLILLSLYVQCRRLDGSFRSSSRADGTNNFFVVAGWPDASLNGSRYGRHRGAGEMKAGGAVGKKLERPPARSTEKWSGLNGSTVLCFLRWIHSRDACVHVYGSHASITAPIFKLVADDRLSFGGPGRPDRAAYPFWLSDNHLRI